MRICLIVECLGGFGGLEEIVTELAIALRKRGHATSVLSTVWVRRDSQYKRKLRENGVAFVEWPVMPLVAALSWVVAALPAFVRERNWSSAVAAKQRWEYEICENGGWWFQTSRLNVPWTRRLVAVWCRIWRPDVFHIHNYVHELNLTHILDWTSGREIPTIFEEHQTPNPQGPRWDDFRSRINKASAVGAVSEKAVPVLRNELGVKRPIFVLPPIVPDPENAADAVPCGEERPTRVLTVTTIARLIPEKGLPYLFEAVASLRRSHSEFRLRLWGDGPFREYSKEMRDSAESFGLDPDEVFAGTYERSDLARIMGETDIFVLPSLNEGTPLTVIEAMAFARPIVATTAGGIPDVLRDEENALLCPPADAAQLAAAVRRFLDDPEERARFGAAARASYERSDCHPDAACKLYLTMYEQTLKDAAGRGAG
jgi:glycosyltransferase involved in cell wall biosynthesis